MMLIKINYNYKCFFKSEILILCVFLDIYNQCFIIGNLSEGHYLLQSFNIKCLDDKITI